MPALVVMPTYNEAENLEPLARAILAQGPEIGLLVVDDNSPDGTGRIADRLAAEDPRVQVLHRPAKLGLGTAYRAGFERALELGADPILTMDADFSHDPAAITSLIRAAQQADLVIGSRYLRGVSVLNWPIQRIVLSLFANWYVRRITGLPVADATSGFRAYRAHVLRQIGLDRILSSGYSFLVEIAFRAYRLGFRLAEVPIIFSERREGRSKLSRRAILEAALMPWRLRLRQLLHRR